MAVMNARLGAFRLNAARLNYAKLLAAPSAPTPATASAAGPRVLSWTGVGASARTDLYFGTSPSPPLFAHNVQTHTPPSSAHAYTLPVPTVLVAGTTYYWKVVHYNEFGSVTGPVWSFTATVPGSVTLVTPANGATNVAVRPTFTWTGAANVSDEVFDLYLDGLMPYATGITGTSYTPDLPIAYGVHRWTVRARNAFPGPKATVWTFTTIADPTTVVITIGGVTPDMRIAGLTIRDQLNNQPNTCGFRVDTTAPVVGQEIKIGLGSLAASNLIFAGRIDTVTSVYEGRPENRAWEVTCQDYTPGLNARKVRRRYAQQGAHLIAQDLMTRYAPSGYTGTGIVSPLPTVEGGIDFTEEDLTACFTRIAQRIGGYWYVDYVKDVHLFLTEATEAPTAITKAARVLLDEPPITHTADLTQVRTRVFVEGGGSEARIPVAAGSTVLPVTDAGWYSGTGGLVVSGPQRIRYTGKGISGGPSAPFAAVDLSGGTLTGGPFTYKITNVIAGSEGTLSAVSNAVTIAPVAAPSGTIAAAGAIPPVPPAPDASGWVTLAQQNMGSGGIDVGQHNYGITFLTATGETTIGGLIARSSSTMDNCMVTVANGSGLAPRVTGIRLYRSKASAPFGPYYFHTDFPVTGGSVLDTKSDASLPATPNPPATNTTGTVGSLEATKSYQWAEAYTTALGETILGTVTTLVIPSGYSAVDLSAIPTWVDPRVTARKLYRTKGNAPGVFYLENDFAANNVATTYQSTKADASLGAAFGGGGTAGGRGQITVSSIALGPGGTTARKLYRTVSGGSVYKLVTTISDNTTTAYTDNKADASLGESASDELLSELTGIATSGDGAILYDISRGAEVNLLVQVDDAAAQAALAAILGTPADGIIEHHIQDRRLAQAQATAVGRADLVLFSRALQTIQYATRDPKTRSGKTISFTLPEMGLTGSFTIQSVDISEIGVASGLYPRYKATASTVKFTIEDVIRRSQLEPIAV